MEVADASKRSIDCQVVSEYAEDTSAMLCCS